MRNMDSGRTSSDDADIGRVQQQPNRRRTNIYLHALLGLVVLVSQVACAEYPNITTKSGFISPVCAQYCVPVDPQVFLNKTVPCEQNAGDNKKLIPCMCTDRPMMRYMLDCAFRKCGPAVPSAIEFGYRLCGDYNISYPAPPEAIRQLNVTIPNDAITIPQNFTGFPKPFSKSLPPPQFGASISDEDVAVTRNQSQSSAGASWRAEALIGVNLLKDGRMGITAMVIWSSLFVALAGEAVGMF